MTTITVRRAGPLTTIQDRGRFGMLQHGISASGPMDRGGYAMAGRMAGAGEGAIEFTTSGIAIEVDGPCRAGLAGGDFRAARNGEVLDWPGMVDLAAGDVLEVSPGAWGNYGYLRFAGTMILEPVMGSLATSSRVGLGGIEGRTLRAGDAIQLRADAGERGETPVADSDPVGGPIRFTWGLHADAFPRAVREAFVSRDLTISSRLDRMGVRLDDPAGVFARASILSLVSDAIVAGDIQVLGDGTPIVLMRDHQPTGGYPRIATIVSADLDRFAQMRPGSPVAFEPVTVEHAHRLLRSKP